MHSRQLHVAAMIALAVVAAACGRSAGSASTPSIRLTPAQDSTPAVVDVAGLPRASLDALRSAEMTPAQWNDVLRVSVEGAAMPMLGAYSVTDDVLRFTPAFPLDPGRPYQVRFDPAALAQGGSGLTELTSTVTVPAEHTTPSTTVTRVYPTGEVVPENLLRMYIEFSGPMGRTSGIPFMKLLDEAGQEIPGAFLPLDYEFWDRDHRRFTAFFDPGRVKGGILPNQQMGRALTPGKTATLVISREWRDEHGLPLKDDYRRTLSVAPADTQPLDPGNWRLQPPSAGQRDGLVVAFPEPLDHGLLMRALGVRRDGQVVEGEVSVDAGETRWTFTPRDPWHAGKYDLLALDILEDVAGNQIGRAFEVDNFDTVDKSPDPKSILIPFTPGPSRTN